MLVVRPAGPAVSDWPVIALAGPSFVALAQIGLSLGEFWAAGECLQAAVEVLAAAGGSFGFAVGTASSLAVFKLRTLISALSRQFWFHWVILALYSTALPSAGPSVTTVRSCTKFG